MDTRTDPGQYYPGGRIMVRPDVAPPQAKVNWSDIEGKPDFSDIAELEAADSVDSVKTAVNKIVDKMTTAVIVLLCGLCAALSAPAATMLNFMSGTNEVYTAAETDAAIVRLAPAPGNYAAVSNAAMSAVQPGELVAATNDIPRVEAANPDMFPGWAQNAVGAGHADYSDNSGHASIADSARSLVDGTGTETRLSDTIFMQLDSIAGKASTNDVQLTPVYGGDGERFGEWVCSPSDWEGNPIRIVKGPAPEGMDGLTYAPYAGSSAIGSAKYFETEPTTIVFDGWAGAPENLLTATRTENPLIGYTLGSQTDKPIASTNAVAAVRAIADAATSTNAAQTAAIASQASQLSQQSQSISTLGSQVSAIGAHLNAEDARFVSTNDNSATHMPEAYVEVKITENGESSWLTVWREMTRWYWFLGIYTNQYAELSAALANKGEREYAFYDGVTGEPAPDGFFWIAQPRVAVAAGMSYQRYVDTGGAVWVLESNGMVADVNGTTNGFFRISDDEGNAQFEIVKGSSRTVSAVPGAMTHESVMGVTHWFTTYAVTNAASAPVAMFCRDIGSPEWHAETDGDCPCNVSWTSPESGVYVCEWWAKGTESKMFMKAKYGQGTESRIVQSAPVEMQYIVINGVKYTLGTATISGNTVLTLSPAAP